MRAARDDLDEGRMVSLFRFEESRGRAGKSIPAARRSVCVVQGHMTLHQELPDGRSSHRNLARATMRSTRAVRHTADADEPVVALFHTAPEGDGQSAPLRPCATSRL